ncbi:hypothetical protein CVIRNUC_000979 [Coccomyxa viridis]|uniref:Uncharacterized protein n=1 Tax=Coccomyxa viridis TaxID=1274662 RepID=A0AAV1HSL8_9CHLO|nr:hypothetical protein CVIRNUC_000979 [Coccomyxa viridis]
MRTAIHFGLYDQASTSYSCHTCYTRSSIGRLKSSISIHRDVSGLVRRQLQPVAAAVAKEAKGQSVAGKKEAHKIFDEAIITVRSGAGGRGEIAEKGEGKKVPNFKYRAGSSLPKQIWLPAAQPADGASGASVLLVADPALDNLLHLHEKKSYSAKSGVAGNPELGSRGPRGRRMEAPRTQPLKLRVPLGTVVKRKRGGALLGELTAAGQTLLVAPGGRGGLGVTKPAPSQQPRGRFVEQEEGLVEDTNWALDAEGAPGEEATLHLLMRVVADVGIVGLPNAGKSSLLAALTRASPDIAPYPFTTLMPNLGVLMASTQPDVQQDDFSDFDINHLNGSSVPDVAAPILADMPGLIQGAHAGRGLGRMFLRHLRRTRGLLHVVDASADDPAADYLVVRQELALYNAEYCARPHIVALNKMDVDDAAQLREEVASDIMAAAKAMQRDWRDSALPQPALPEALVHVSAVEGTGIAPLREALQSLLQWASL